MSTMKTVEAHEVKAGDCLVISGDERLPVHVLEVISVQQKGREISFQLKDGSFTHAWHYDWLLIVAD